MRSFAIAALFGTLVVATPLLVSSDALADVGICGALASSSCTFVAGGGCMTQCDPLHMTETCGVSCSNNCTQSATTTCSTDCDTNCKKSCTPGQTHCSTYCEEDCKVSCEGFCHDSTCQGECEGSCKGQCTQKCVQDPPDCDTICKTSCETSCQVKENLMCYVDCEGSCTTMLTGGCKTDCQAPFGALFCDGQYVHLDNYNDCAASFGLKASVTANCSAAPGRSAPAGGAALVFAAALGLLASKRRTRR